MIQIHQKIKSIKKGVNMENYYVNNDAQSTGEHEVHKDGCSYMPRNKTYLGLYTNCAAAVQKARTVFSNVDGCYYCCNACHTR
jgi:hypothetical protein